MKRLVFALLILFCGNDMSAQTYTKEVCVRFPVASSVLNPNFGDNAACLADIGKVLTDVQIDSTLKLTSVKFCGSASPEGGPLLNQRLTERRCANMERYVRERVQLPDAIVSKCECSEMWQKLAYFVEKSDMPYRDEVLHQIRETEEFTYNSKGVLVESPQLLAHLRRRHLAAQVVRQGIEGEAVAGTPPRHQRTGVHLRLRARRKGIHGRHTRRNTLGPHKLRSRSRIRLLAADSKAPEHRLQCCGRIHGRTLL